MRRAEPDRDLLRPATSDDRDEAIALAERRERLAHAVHRLGELGARDDLRERAVEVEDDPAGRRAVVQRAEVSQR